MTSITRNRVWHLGFCDLATKEAVQIEGGMCAVYNVGTPDKATLYDYFTAQPIANPVPLVRGSVRFALPEDTTHVDIYAMMPTGHFITKEVHYAKEFNELSFDSNRRDQVLQLPFSFAEGVNVEVNTGMQFPVGSAITGDGATLNVIDVDAGITMDVGLLSTETGGDADGLMAAVTVGTAGYTSAHPDKLGALLAKSYATSPPVPVPINHEINAGQANTLSFTLASGADTAKGRIVLPYRTLAYSSV